MSQVHGQHERRIRVRTVHRTVEGILKSSTMLRLLDDLNAVSRTFLTIHEPVISRGDWPVEDGPLAISLSTIVFVHELSEPPPNVHARAVSASHFTRAPIRLWVEGYSMEGSIHVPPRGSAMTRLCHDLHPFLALTEVSVRGPDSEFSTPFLAVNRAHILAGQEILVVKEEAAAEGVFG